MRRCGQPIQKAKQGCGKPFCNPLMEPEGCGELARPCRYWKVMSMHFEMSEPRPEEMVMQPRIFCVVTSAAHTE
jgi:hypothetical protein